MSNRKGGVTLNCNWKDERKSRAWWGLLELGCRLTGAGGLRYSDGYFKQDLSLELSDEVNMRNMFGVIHMQFEVKTMRLDMSSWGMRVGKCPEDRIKEHLSS